MEIFGSVIVVCLLCRVWSTSYLTNVLAVCRHRCVLAPPSPLEQRSVGGAMAPLTERASKDTALLPISVIFEAHRCLRCNRTAAAAAKRRYDYARIPGQVSDASQRLAA
jgi:hypothetical protein